MPKLENLHDLLILELQDLYSAETQLVKALPKLAKAASDENLRTLFNDHLEETKEHVARLERIADLLEFSPKGKKCQGMEGLIAEGAERIDEKAQPSVRDAALICAAQKAEHYEISSYGTLRTFAELLGYDEVAELLQETKDEEVAADEKLTGVAGDINVEAEADEPEEND
jgi:ferritin-like metal-binding protein YciE